MHAFQNNTFIVVWQAHDSDNNNGIFATIYGADLTVSQPQFVVWHEDMNDYFNTNPNVAIFDQEFKFIIAWRKAFTGCLHFYRESVGGNYNLSIFARPPANLLDEWGRAPAAPAIISSWEGEILLIFSLAKLFGLAKNAE